MGVCESWIAVLVLRMSLLLTPHTERSLDFAPLLAKANLAKLPIQLLKLSFFFFSPSAVNHPDDKSHR